MPRIPYTIRLTGLDAPEGAISMATLAELCRDVIEGAGRALRLQAEGASTKSGPVPEWIREATDFTIDGLSKGSTILALDVPPLAETPLFGGDGAPADGFDPTETALSVFAHAVADLEAGNLDSERLDRGFLDTLARFARLGDGVRVEFIPDSEIRSRRADAFVIDSDIIASATRLQRETPADHAVVLTGLMETIEHGDARFTLATDRRGRVRGNLLGDAPTERLRELWGRRVTVSGMARLTLSGRVRFVEATSARPFADGDDIVSDLTAPPQLLPEMDQPRRSGNAVASLAGGWPGDEPIDVLLAALRDEPAEGE